MLQDLDHVALLFGHRLPPQGVDSRPVAPYAGGRTWTCQDPAVMTGERWTVLYDGDCGLCKWMLAGLLVRARERRLAPLALQHADAAPLVGDLPLEERM